MQFGERLRAARLAAGMTQDELAAACDRPRAYIARLESGKGDPRLSTVVRLAEGLRIVSAELMKDIEA